MTDFSFDHVIAGLGVYIVTLQAALGEGLEFVASMLLSTVPSALISLTILGAKNRIQRESRTGLAHGNHIIKQSIIPQIERLQKPDYPRDILVFLKETETTLQSFGPRRGSANIVRSRLNHLIFTRSGEWAREHMPELDRLIEKQLQIAEQFDYEYRSGRARALSEDAKIPLRAADEEVRELASGEWRPVAIFNLLCQARAAVAWAPKPSLEQLVKVAGGAEVTVWIRWGMGEYPVARCSRADLPIVEQKIGAIFTGPEVRQCIDTLEGIVHAYHDSLENLLERLEHAVAVGELPGRCLHCSRGVWWPWSRRRHVLMSQAGHVRLYASKQAQVESDFGVDSGFI